jgi:TolB protein
MKMTFTRRSAIGLAASATLAPLASARAARVLDLRAGGFQPVSIAVTNFAGDDAARTVTSVILNNFKRSVFLKPLDPASLVEQNLSPDQPPNLAAWRTVSAQFILAGRSQRGADGRLKTEFRLWDVATGEQAAGSQFVTDANNVRRVAHLVSDMVFKIGRVSCRERVYSIV